MLASPASRQHCNKLTWASVQEEVAPSSSVPVKVVVVVVVTAMAAAAQVRALHAG